MKKFLVTLLILLILAGTVFFLGWSQMSVPVGYYGVINSKTHGVNPELVRSGEFRWIWYKLIPTNVNIAVFRLDPVNFTMNFSSSLPSGDTYASFAGIEADFSICSKLMSSLPSKAPRPRPRLFLLVFSNMRSVPFLFSKLRRPG